MEKYRIDTNKGLEFGLYSIGDHLLNPHNRKSILAQNNVFMN